MAATLDIISRGRLGWHRDRLERAGVLRIRHRARHARPASDRFEDACEVLTKLLSAQETSTFSGRSC